MLNYKELIRETVSELEGLEKKHRNSVQGTRITFLRLLKTGEVRSVKKASEAVKYSLRQCQRWLESYREEGIDSLVKPMPKSPGRPEQMTAEAWVLLTEKMLKGEIKKYKQVRDILAEEGINYTTNSGIHRLFKRHQIKAKTGRPQSEKTAIEVQENFKKNSLTN